MREKYLNDAFIGNHKIKASFTEKGEMLRLFYGAADFKQFLDEFYTGIKVNDSNMIYLHNEYEQEYVKDTNILVTNIFNTYFKVRVTQMDFAPMGEKFIIKKCTIKNESENELNISYYIYSKILTNLNNDTAGLFKADSLVQYNHDFSVCTFSNQKIDYIQINNSKDRFREANLDNVNDIREYIGMSPDSAIGYNLYTLEPGEEKTVTIFVFINKNKYADVIQELSGEIARIKSVDVEELKNETAKYWRTWLLDHDIHDIYEKDIDQKIKEIYSRTILLFPLLINNDTGGISAGIEVDEERNNCGRYSYCWPRDAAFITEAMDLVGMSDIADKFYLEFCRNTQSEDGMWEQRFYTDGRLAPSWGYQVDETASVIFGAYAHYKETKSRNFLVNCLDMLEKAIEFLYIYVDDLFNGNHSKVSKSFDLWEERPGVSLYSIASVFAGFSAMKSIYREIKPVFEENPEKIRLIELNTEKLNRKAVELKEYATNTFYSEERNSYVRNLEDKKIDISVIGTIVPFKMYNVEDLRMQNTINKIEEILHMPKGGFVRYENDTYMGGKNPWPIVTLWMSWYYLQAGEIEKAKDEFLFVVNSASKHGYLGEQVNSDTMKPMWVIGLTWSHAMFLLTLKKLIDKDLL